MEIDLSLLHSKTILEVDISNTYIIPKIYYQNTDIISLSSIVVAGKVYQKEDEDYINCNIKGTMLLADSISLEEVKYPFSIKYDDIIEENCKKKQNILDIFQFLWENIVLEIPLQFTKVKDLSKFHGDGWKLLSEDELHTANNPFSELLKDFKEE